MVEVHVHTKGWHLLAAALILLTLYSLRVQPLQARAVPLEAPRTGTDDAQDVTSQSAGRGGAGNAMSGVDHMQLDVDQTYWKGRRAVPVEDIRGRAAHALQRAARRRERRAWATGENGLQNGDESSARQPAIEDDERASAALPGETRANTANGRIDSIAADGDGKLRSGKGLTSLDTAALVQELHSREYTWETLSGAGLRWSNFSADQLLWWLQRDRDSFRDVLHKSHLGLKSFTSAELLKELTGREDLSKALMETGLGSGTDFNCAQDESPRDGGCQKEEAKPLHKRIPLVLTPVGVCCAQRRFTLLCTTRYCSELFIGVEEHGSAGVSNKLVAGSDRPARTMA
eukprot:1318188-Pleurochrysis_carterae.AAC.1